MMRMTKNEFLIEQAEQAIQEALSAPTPRATEILRQAIGDLFFFGDLADSQACSALGCCWYHLPSCAGDPREEARKWLYRALELEPGNHLARLYLGRMLFDDQHYAEARALFQLVPDDYFAAFGKSWIDLKKEEWTLCCDLFLSRGELDLERLRAICHRFASLPEDDAPVPSELVRAFAWTARTPGNAACPREAVGECAALIRRMGLAEAFAPELETLHGKAVAAPSTGRIIDCETEFNFDDDFRYAYETRYQVRARENIA